MGIFNFFKKKKIEEKQNEQVSIENLEKWVQNKKQNLESQKNEFNNSLKVQVANLITTLENKKTVLLGINLDEKKEKERIKSIVKENFNNYKKHLDKLIKNLNIIDFDKDPIREINTIFYDFKKRSEGNYQKATYLIGKELGDIKDTIAKFFNGTAYFVKQNKDFIDESKTILSLEEKTKEFLNTKITLDELNTSIVDGDIKISHSNEKIKQKNDQIDEIKSSPGYQEQIKKIAELNLKKQKLESEIQELGRLIDFKTLTNFHHKFEKEMNLIKEYKRDFKETYHKTKGQDLLKLFLDASIDSEKILKKIREINKEKHKLENTFIEEIDFENLKDEIEKFEFEIRAIHNEMEKNKKRIIKLEDTKGELFLEIKSILIKMQVDIVK